MNGLILVGLALLVLILRLNTLFMSEINMDDSVFMLYGRSLMRGAVPYVDFWDHHPLGAVVLFGVAGRLFGYSYLTQRWLTIIAVIVECFLLYRLGHTLGRRSRLTGLVAALIFAIYSLNNLGQAADRIFLSLPLVTLAMIWYCSRPLLDGDSRPAEPLSTAKLLAIGLFMALSVQIKALFLADYLPLVLLITYDAWRRGRPASGAPHRELRRVAGQIARPWALLATPVILLFLVNIAYFAYHGRLDGYVFANFVAPSIYARTTPTSLTRIVGRFIYQLTSNPLAWVGLLIAPLYLLLAKDVDRSERRGFAILFLWLLFPLIAVLATRRLDGHHFLQLLAPLSLITGLSIAGLLGLGEKPATIRQALVVLLIVVCTLVPPAYSKLFDTAKTLAGRFIAGQPWPEDANVGVAHYLQDHIQPGEGLFVVDYNPVIYTLVDAPIPTPYYLFVFLVDEWYEDVVNIDQVQALDEAMARKPAYVVMQARPNREYTNPRVAERLAEHLAADYSLETTLPGVETYTNQPVDVRIYKLSQPSGP